MTGETLLVFGILFAAVVLFASDRVRLDVVAILVVLALMLSGVLTVAESLAGFGDRIVLMIAALFVVGEGLVRTGVAYAVGNWLMQVAGASETRMMTLLMLVVAGFGAFMSSTGIVAIFIPIVLAVSAKTGMARGRLMMPLAFAALISGMLTLIATPPNLIVSDALRGQGLEPFGFFSFTPIGLAVLALAIGFMLWIGRRLLPDRRDGGDRQENRRTLLDLVEAYRLRGRLHRLRVRPASPLAGLTVAEARLRTAFGVTILGVEHRDRFTQSVKPALAETVFAPHDILYAIGGDGEVAELAAARGLDRLPLDERRQRSLAQDLGLAEMLVTPDSRLVGRTLGEAAFRSRHGVSVLAIRRRGEPLAGRLIDERLAAGDLMLVSGGWKAIRTLKTETRDFVVLGFPVEMADVAPARDRAPTALAILFGMIGLMTFDLVPAVAAVLIAALALVVTRCVTMDAAYRSVNWQSLVLIAGMLPLATALDKTGGTHLIAASLTAGLGAAGPFAMMAGLFAITAGIGLLVSNTATAVLMAPIAISVAQDMAVSPYPFAMTIAIAASAAFATPISSPVNTLVLEPGDYRFSDFVRTGLPLLLLTMVLALVVIPLIFPF